MNVTTEIDGGVGQQHRHSLEDLFMSDLWMCGITPPPAIVPLIRVSSSSSPRIASCKCLGVIRFTFRSLLAFPASSNTSAVRYSKIAAEYTAAVAPTLPFAVVLSFSNRWIRPTGNCRASQMLHNQNKTLHHVIHTKVLAVLSHEIVILMSTATDNYMNCSPKAKVKTSLVKHIHYHWYATLV